MRKMDKHITLYAWLGWMKGQKQAGPQGLQIRRILELQGRLSAWRKPTAALVRSDGLAAKVQSPTVLSQKRALKMFYCGLEMLHAQLLLSQCSSDFSKRRDLAMPPKMP